MVVQSVRQVARRQVREAAASRMRFLAERKAQLNDLAVDVVDVDPGVRTPSWWVLLLEGCSPERMSSMGSKKRKSYTPEYRREAAHLVIDTGRTIAAVATEINVGAQLLGRWVQLERDRIGAPPEAALDVSERAELERLRRENAELRLDNEFLGKAAAFFAAKNTPGRSASR